jgi:hypothetical protein
MLTMSTSDWTRAQEDQACRQIGTQVIENFTPVPVPQIPGHAGFTSVFKRQYNDIYSDLTDNVKTYASEFLKTQLIPENKEIWQSKFAAGLPLHVATALSAPKVGNGFCLLSR